jgi:hypothetical protein
MPKCLSNLQDSIYNQLIVESIKDGVSAHMAEGHITRHAAAKELLGTLVASIRTSGKNFAQHLGLFRRCVQNYKQHCLLIDNGDLDFWSGTTKRQQSDALSPKVKVLVLEWSIMEIIISPDRKKVSKKRLGVKQNVEHPTHFLQVFQVNNSLLFLACFK